MTDLITEKNLKMIDIVFEGINFTKMIFIDKLGNEFKMSPQKVKSGQWSPFESGYVYNNPDYHLKACPV